MKRFLLVFLVVTAAFAAGVIAERAGVFRGTPADLDGNNDPRVVALRYGIYRNGFDTHGVTAFENPELIRYFKDLDPPVVAFDNERYRKVRPKEPDDAVSFACDTFTGERITLWSVSEAKIDGDNAEVYVKWYRTGLCAREDQIFLKRLGGAWVVVSSGMMWISSNGAVSPAKRIGDLSLAGEVRPQTGRLKSVYVRCGCGLGFVEGAFFPAKIPPPRARRFWVPLWPSNLFHETLLLPLGEEDCPLLLKIHGFSSRFWDHSTGRSPRSISSLRRNTRSISSFSRWVCFVFHSSAGEANGMLTPSIVTGDIRWLTSAYS